MSGNNKCGNGCPSEVNEGINCTICDTAFHPKCAGMTLAAVRVVRVLTYFNWFCNACGEKYGNAAVKAATSDSNISQQLSEIRDLVVDCAAKVDAATGTGWRPSSSVNELAQENPRPSVQPFDRRRNLIIAGSYDPGTEDLDLDRLEA